MALLNHENMKRLPLFLCCCLALSCLPAQHSDEILTELRIKIEQGSYPNIEGIILEHQGNIEVEEYYNGFTRDSLHDTRSAFKSVTSMLAGIAIDQGLFELDDKLENFFPEWKDDERGNITVRHLLEMKTGLDCEEFYGFGPDCEDPMWESKDWIAFCLDLELIHHPGQNWSYSSIPPMLMGEVIARQSGMTLMAFAKQYLFDPLGIEGYRWTLSPKGRGMAAGSFFIRPIDMLKLIKLVQQGGTWQGQRIVSQAWLDLSTTCSTGLEFSFLRSSHMHQATYHRTNYGLYWYRERLSYQDIDTEVLFASGNGGQYMMWLADYDALVVFTGGNYGNWRGKLPFEILLKYLIPIMGRED